MLRLKSLALPQKIFLLLFLGLVFLYSFNQLKESDAFYHLKAGQVIWETKSVPQEDIFSYTAAGKMWVTHEWLAELIFYGVWSAAGFWGLIAFVAFIAAITYLFVFLLAVKKGANPNVALLLLFTLGYLTFELWIPRPQVFAFLCLSLLLYLLESYRSENKKLYLWLAVLTIWFWANVNASFLLGLVIIFFYAGAEILKSFSPETLGKPAELAKSISIGIAAAASLLLSFANPNGYKIFLYSFYIRPAVKTLQIMEWKPIYYFLYETRALIFTGGMAVIAAVLAYWFWFRKENRDITWLGAALGVFWLPLISIRHVGFLPFAGIAPFAVAVSGIFKRKIDSLSPKFFPTIMPALFLLFAVLRYGDFPRTPLNERLIPVRTADFIEENKIKGPFFNLYNEGGYLIWRLWPEEKVFIDGRSEIYGGQPINELFTIVGRLNGWQGLVDEKYKINAFILPYYPDSLTKDTGAMTSELLKNGFHFVHWDNNNVLLLRRTKETAALVDKYELKHVSPFRNPAGIPESEAKAAAAELEELISREPDSELIKEYVRRFIGVPLGER